MDFEGEVYVRYVLLMRAEAVAVAVIGVAGIRHAPSMSCVKFKLACFSVSANSKAKTYQQTRLQ